jgi:hypothetical protein
MRRRRSRERRPHEPQLELPFDNEQPLAMAGETATDRRTQGATGVRSVTRKHADGSTVTATSSPTGASTGRGVERQ